MLPRGGGFLQDKGSGGPSTFPGSCSSTFAFWSGERLDGALTSAETGGPLLYPRQAGAHRLLFLRIIGVSFIFLTKLWVKIEGSQGKRMSCGYILSKCLLG